MLGELDCDQLREWAAFYEIEPWGDPYGQACLVAWAVLTALGGDKRLSPDDLHPSAVKRRHLKREQYPDEDELAKKLDREFGRLERQLS